MVILSGGGGGASSIQSPRKPLPRQPELETPLPVHLRNRTTGQSNRSGWPFSPSPDLGMEAANQVRKPEKTRGAEDTAPQGLTPGDRWGGGGLCPHPWKGLRASVPSRPQQETPGTGTRGQEWVSSHRRASDHAERA